MSVDVYVLELTRIYQEGCQSNLFCQFVHLLCYNYNNNMLVILSVSDPTAYITHCIIYKLHLCGRSRYVNDIMFCPQVDNQSCYNAIIVCINYHFLGGLHY